MNKGNNTGYYLKQTLTKHKLVVGDVMSLLNFILEVPKEDFDEGFTLSSDIRFALNGIKEEYTALSRKYEPSIEFVLFNSLVQEEIVFSLKKLAGKRKNKTDLKVIEALKENLILERLRKDIDENVQLKEGTLIGQLKLILKKKQII